MSDVTPQHGLVISATRRHVTLLVGTERRRVRGRLSSHARDVTVGDTVALSEEKGEAFVESILPHRNCLSRAYREKKKKLAANLDRVFIVTAAMPLFNPVFVDRTIAVAETEEIPCTLIVNKTDLDLEDTMPLIETYAEIRIPILFTSARSGEGLDEVEAALRDPALNTVALVGVSGVGKSSLLNHLVPEAARATGEVSRTGQGRQTTTQSHGYLYPRPGLPELLIIDLPGIQKFGVTHLTPRQVAYAFVEFREPARVCQFADCSHTAEEQCGVKAKFEEGLISASRYYSYLDMLEEIEAAREW